MNDISTFRDSNDSECHTLMVGVPVVRVSGTNSVKIENCTWQAFL